MDMRISKVVLAGLFLVAFVNQVWAAEIVKLGFFDKQAIVDRSAMGQEGEQKFKSEMEKIREKLEAERQEIKNLQEEFDKKKLIWSDEVKKTKLQELLTRRQELERLIIQSNRELERLEQELLRPLKEKLLDIVIRIGKEEGYTLIFERGDAGIFYAPNSLNITERIIQELNATSSSEKTDQ
jgi:outer membrane protein